MELKSATTHVLLNCPEVQPYHSNGGWPISGELRHSEGIYEEFDATILVDLNNYGEGTSRANEEESQTEEYETSDDELLEENEISDEEEFD
ncbi:hypothetical protein H5410_041926, partial [Solanum commersonii]